MQGGHEPLLVDVGLLDGVHQLAEDVLHHGGPGEEAVPGPVQGLPDQKGQAQGWGGALRGPQEGQQGGRAAGQGGQGGLGQGDGELWGCGAEPGARRPGLASWPGVREDSREESQRRWREQREP